MYDTTKHHCEGCLCDLKKPKFLCVCQAKSPSRDTVGAKSEVDTSLKPSAPLGLFL